MFEYFEQETGIRINFIHVAEDLAYEELLKAIESGALPDLIELDWQAMYPDGPDQAVADGVIRTLNPLLRRHAPNLTRLLSGDVHLAQSIASETGTVYGFPCLRLDDKSRIDVGPVFRAEWLEATRQQIPETIDEWHSVLTAFKEDAPDRGTGSRYPFFLMTYQPFGAEHPVAPYLEESNIFAGAYGTAHSFYRHDGEVRFGPFEEAYRNMLDTLAGWYAEGLIDPSIGVFNRIADSNIRTQRGAGIARSGATVVELSILPVLSSMDLVPAPPPVIESPSTAVGSMMSPRYGGERTVGVSTACREPERAVQWLDIGYSEAGHLAYNYGVPRETYTYSRGEVTLTEEVKANLFNRGKEGTIFRSTLFETARCMFGGPYVVDGDLISIVGDAAVTNGGGSIRAWSKIVAEPVESILLGYPTERSEYRSIMAPIRGHVLRNFVAFVTGSRSLDEFALFQSEIYSMGIEQAHRILDNARTKSMGKQVVF